MAKVEVIGTVDVDQFWPKGDSDADTLVVRVKEIRVTLFKGADTALYASKTGGRNKTTVYAGGGPKSERAA